MAGKVREYELTIGENVEIQSLLEDVDASNTSNSIPESDIRTIPENQAITTIVGLDLIAEVVQSRENSFRTQTSHIVQVYNTTSSQEENMRVGNSIILKAGFNSDTSLPLIFAAQIVQVNIFKDRKGNRIAKLLCAEAAQQREKLVYSTVYAKTLTYEDVLNDLLGKMASYGVPTGRVQLSDDVIGRQLGKAFCISGNLANTFNRVITNIKHRAYISGAALYIEPIGKNIDELQEVYSLTPSVIRNTIETSDSSINKTLDELSVRTQGIYVEVDLDGNLNDADGISVSIDPESRRDPNFDSSYEAHAGTYKITSLIHRLNFRGKSWSTFITAKD